MWPLLTVLLAIGVSPTSQPVVVASQPFIADTQPALDDSLQDRPLEPEEKKAYLAALAQNRKTRLADSDALRTQLKVDLAEEINQYNQRFQSQLKQMQTNENARNKAQNNKNNMYNGSDASTHSNRIRQNEKEMERAKADRDKRIKIIADVNRRLDCLEACHNACLDLKTNTEFDQLRKASVNRKRADLEHGRILPFKQATWIEGRHFYNLTNIVSAVEKEYASMAEENSPAKSVNNPEIPGPTIQPLKSADGLVSIGMKRADVQQLMGGPTRSEGLKWYYQKSAGLTRIITFDSAGKVANIE